MADPLSVGASVIAVVQLAERLISLGYIYIGGAKTASKDLRDLVDELQSLGKVLVVLQDYAQADKNLQSTALQSLNGQNGPLQGCALELRRPQLKLEPKQGLKGMIQSIKWPLKEPETLQYIARIQRQKNLFILALTVDHISLCKAIEAYVKNIDHTAEEIKVTMQDKNTTVRDLEAKFAREVSAQGSWRQKQEALHIVENREKILNWIYPDTTERKHLEISSRRQKNTGNWLLEAPQFQELLNDRNSTLLWGYGIPGAGKTFLSSAAIDYLQDQTSIKNHIVAYIYFDYKEQENQMPVHILASLVKQLASQLPGLQIPKEIEDLHEKLRYQGKRPTLEELYAVLKILLHNRVYLIFDALDECHPINQRKDLLPLFHRLANDGASLFLTSRHYPEDIQQSLRNSKKIELEAKETDIKTYIQEKISESPRAKRLIEQSNWMFLLVKFHVEYICQQTTANQVLDALESLRLQKLSVQKRPLDPTYDRVMRSIREQSEACAELAIKVLSWLVNARRTLTVKEIQTAISVDPSRCEIDELDLTDKETLLEVCASLVVIDEHSNTIKLAHYTVQDYLLRKSIIPQDVNLGIAITCITFLSFKTFATGACTSNESLEARLQTYPFLDYAAHNLSPHLNECSDQEVKSVETILRFLASPENISSYLQVVHAWGYGKGDSEHFNRYPKDHLPIHVASYLGHCEVIRVLLEGADFSIPANTGWENVYRAAFKGNDAVVRLLLEKRADVTASESNGLTALHMAAAKGHQAAVQILLEKGSDITLSCKKGETALHTAASQGHQAVIQVLLNQGAKVCISKRDLNGRTALHTAAFYGHLTVTQMLIDNGADVSIPADFGETVLHMAVIKEHELVTKLLLNSGANVSAQDNFGRAALHIAIYKKNEMIVRLLLDKGGDVCAKTNSQETALGFAIPWGNESIIRLLLERGADISVVKDVLCIAASNGHQKVVQLLLERGVDISSTRGGSTALHLATANGHKAVIQLLLEKGADIEAANNIKRTALHLAALNGHQAVVQLLLEKGADIEAANNIKRTALHLAALNGHQAVVQVLLKKGANIKAVQEDGWAALHLAASKGRQPVVQLLLENGTETSIVNNNKKTALHLAALNGRQAVVQLLLEKGADIEAVDTDGRTALHLAALNGHQAVVQVLLKKGVNIKAVEVDEWTALHLAASEGHQVVVQLLLGEGADIEAVEVDGWTALHLAASEGHQVVVQLLLGEDADIEAVDTDGQKALHLAAINGHQAVVQILLEKGADIKAVQEGGLTALHLAASEGHQPVVQLLLEKGADIEAVNNNKQTALYLAAHNGHQAVVQLLLEKGADIEAVEADESTALHLATSNGHQAVVRLLLKQSVTMKNARR